jgi:hypothetical protein
MKKRGDSNLIATVLIILIAIILIVLIWIFVSFYIKNQGEKIVIKDRLNRERFELKEVDLSGGNITIDLKTGSRPQTEGNLTIIEINWTQIIVNQTNGSLDIISIVDMSGSMSYIVGYYSEGFTKADLAINSSRNLVDYVLENKNNSLGFVTFDENAKQAESHALSKDPVSLNAKIDTWKIAYMSAGTCICCGIDKAKRMFKDSKNFKFMILMSDGSPTNDNLLDFTKTNEEFYNLLPESLQKMRSQSYPGGYGSYQDNARYIFCAINETIESYKAYKIPIYTIGFGDDANDIILGEIANLSDGKYYKSSETDLSKIYQEIISNITVRVEEEVNRTRNESRRTYKLVKTFDYLKVVIQTEDGEIYIRNISFEELAPPLEACELKIPMDDLGVAPEDIVRIEAYPAVITEDEDEILSSRPVFIWEKPGLYSKR